MELNINLLEKRKKSIFSLILGIILILISILSLIVKYQDNHILTSFDWLYFGVFLLGGLFNFFTGLGYPIENLFGKAFILIDEKQISIKSEILKSEQKVLWNDIKSIDYKASKYNIQEKNGNVKSIDLSALEYNLLIKIKDIIGIIAEKKDISIN